MVGQAGETKCRNTWLYALSEGWLIVGIAPLFARIISCSRIMLIFKDEVQRDAQIHLLKFHRVALWESPSHCQVGNFPRFYSAAKMRIDFLHTSLHFGGISLKLIVSKRYSSQVFHCCPKC